MLVRRVISAVALIILVLTLTAVAAGCGGGGEKVSLDAFASSAGPACSEFADRVSPSNPRDPAPYEDAASALAELALPSGAAERKRAEALIEAMDEAAVATREFSNAIEEYVDPGMNWVLTENGDLYQNKGTLLSSEPVTGFPTEIGLRYMQGRDALRQSAADIGLEECVPPEDQ